MPKPFEEYPSAQRTRVVSLRLLHADADMLERRAAGAGASPRAYVVALLRSKKTPEHDLHQVADLASATAAIYALKNELAKVRAEVSGGFGLMKQAFITTPDVALANKPAVDEACRVAKAVIREAERAIARVETAAAGPLADLEEAVTAIRTGSL